MTDLRPCSHCGRHVRSIDTACPFCGVVLSIGPSIVEPRRRLSRAAVFAAATLTATACWTNKSEPKHVEQQTVVAPPDASSASIETVSAPPVDAAMVVAAPPPDAAIVQQHKPPPPPPPFDPFQDKDGGRRVQHHPCTMTPKGPICAPYGAPPARRRVV